MSQTSAIPPRGDHLLERAEQLAALEGHLAAVVASSRGRLVLLGGEAGVGKTALVSRFVSGQAAARVLSGACDPLFTPRPLGAVIDIAQAAGGELMAVAEDGRLPHEVASALARELRARRPTIVVIEDVHWADEATLDVIRLLGRRVQNVPALIVATYRDDELDRTHPLRVVLGDMLGADGIFRVKLAPLSAAATAALARPFAVNAQELYHKTGGNPFFIGEVLATGKDEIPDTVRDAVLARIARISTRARDLVEATAAVPPQAELWLLEAIAPDCIDRLEECLAVGILEATPAGVGFRHELARLAVAESCPPDRSLRLQRAALQALSNLPAGTPDLARLAHHAEASGDAGAVLRYAPAAAERASAFGAQREAAAQYARALRFSHGASKETVADFQDRRAYACYLGGQFPEAIEAQVQALELYRGLNQPLREGDALRSLSRLLRYVGRVVEAADAAAESVAILEPHPPGHELAMAYCNLSHHFVNAEDAQRGSGVAMQALELAQRLDDVEALVYARTNLAVVDLLKGEPRAYPELEELLRVAQDNGMYEHAGRIYVAFTWWAPRDKSYAIADRYLEPGLEFCAEHGLDLWHHYLLAYRARRDLDRGMWDEAVRSAEAVIHDSRTSPVPRIVALAVLGLVRARRGDPACWPPLDEARALAENTGELQRLEPAAAARAEAAWLEGRADAVVDATGATFEVALHRHARWVAAELACWRRRAGVDEAVPDGAPEPYLLQIRGDWSRAHELWATLGCPYEAAMSLAGADDEEALGRALREFQQMGAKPAASIVSRRLRERGVRGVPRGRRASTRQHPDQLTSREIEVASLVTEGLTNAEIGRRLHLSTKTVDHHVSAILQKLGVTTRGQAVAKLR